MRAQVALVYFFGGVAKLNFDWLRGYPLREWLPGSDFYVPPLSDLLHEGWVALLFSYSGLLIDVRAAPLLLWRPTRYWMLSVLLLFHFMNEQLYSIGVFPVLASALTLLFLPPDWPRRVFNWPHPGDQAPTFARLPNPHWPPSPPISPCKPCSPCATGSTPAMSAGPRKATATPGI